MFPVQHITRTGQFRTRVTQVSVLSPRMRRIELAADEIAATEWPLACDIAIVLTGPEGREVRRRYTVRRSSHDQLTVDAVLHGHGPGSAWAEQLARDDSVCFYGPRGRIDPPGPFDARPLIAVTDESGLPAIAALAEALTDQRRITVLAEIADPDERYPLPESADPIWLERRGASAGTVDLLAPALTASLTETGLPGFGYVITETRAAVVLRDLLIERGVPRDRVYTKGYWHLNSRPTR
jgi:NADPH-dependent ferric siderophore reductase